MLGKIVEMEIGEGTTVTAVHGDGPCIAGSAVHVIPQADGNRKPCRGPFRATPSR
jgi:hypothetical protein